MKWEIPCINNVMIKHPFKRVPVDVCPREEIASPHKLLAFAQTKEYDWDAIRVFDHEYQRAWIQCRTRYDAISSKVRSHGLYALTRDPQVLLSVLNVDETSVDDVLNWLRHYALTPIVITCPLLSYRTRYQEVLYTITNTFPQRIVHVAPFTDLTLQMVANNAYTIANGLTLAIAMHRNGFWDSCVFSEALSHWLQENSNPYTDITPDIQDLVVQHLIPNVCDHPYFYACMGKHKAHIRVIQMLHNSYEVYEPFVQQQSEQAQVVTSAALQMLPHTQLHIFDYVTANALNDEHQVISGGTRIDIGGLMQAMFTQRGVWKRWKMVYRESLLSYSAKFASTDEFIDQCMRRICMLYKRGVHQSGHVKTSRMRAFWYQIMEVLDPKGEKLRKWVHKHVILTYIRQEATDTDMFNTLWLPEIPVAFLLDLFKFSNGEWKLWQPHPISVTTVHDNLIPVFPNAVVKTMIMNDQTYYTYAITLPITHMISRFDKESSLRVFLNILKSVARERLKVMHCAFNRPTLTRVNENDAYTLWVILQDYFTDHKEKLCL